MGSEVCVWIIGGLATSVVALSGYIVKLHRDLRAVQNDHLETMRSHERLLASLIDTVRKNKGTRHG